MVTHLIVATKYKNVVKKKLYDESFIEYPKNVSNKILGDYYSKIDYSAYDEAKLLKLIKELKVAEHGVRLFLNISV